MLCRCNVEFAMRQFKTSPIGFMDDHPGGVDILRQHAGEDASQYFDDIGHSNNALKQMQTLLVGTMKK